MEPENKPDYILLFVPDFDGMDLTGELSIKVKTVKIPINSLEVSNKELNSLLLESYKRAFYEGFNIGVEE